MFPKVAVAFLICFFPIVVDTIVGLRSIDPALVQLARSMGAPPRRIFLRLRLPGALPSMFGGLKVGSALAVVGALTGEFIGSDNGLGYLLLSAAGELDTALLFAILFVLSLLAMAFFYAIEVLERLMIPWHVSQRAPYGLNRVTARETEEETMRTVLATAAAAALIAVSMTAQAADQVSLRTDWIKSAYHAVWYHAKDKESSRKTASTSTSATAAAR